ncbi:MAG: CapA family protein [Ruminococcaceae bacterium]|nr:CapA family protein [Oscillospiraceae bacterium]
MKTLLIGDVSPSKTSKELFRKKEVDTLFTNVKDLMLKSEFTFVNLECAITEETQSIKKFGPPLSAPVETAEILKELGVTVCGLSNNHTFDLGIKGHEDTKAALDAAGLDYTGWGDNYEDSRKNYYYEKNGEKICIIAVCEHEYSYAIENRMGARPFDEFDTIDDIREAKKNADRVIVAYHGGKEYCRYPSPRLMKVCHAMAKAGADVVLCQHTHCIGCYEEFNGCHILYGQGNFHFLGLTDKEGWYTGFVVEYDTKSHEINFVPTRVLSNGISLAEGEDKRDILECFRKRNEELKNGEWKKGWLEFCEKIREQYCSHIAKVCVPGSTPDQDAALGHYIDCEAHQDVLREIFKSWNYTNCIDGK